MQLNTIIKHKIWEEIEKLTHNDLLIYFNVFCHGNRKDLSKPFLHVFIALDEAVTHSITIA